jgi:hypothetical protein
LTISFSGLPTSSVAQLDAVSSATRPSSQQTTTVLDVHAESAVDNAANNAEALQTPAGFETISAVVDTAAQFVGPVQTALDHAESLKGTLDCLAEAAGYINGVVELINQLANVRPAVLC